MSFLKRFSLLILLILSIGAVSSRCRADNQKNEKGFSINPFFQEVNLEKDQTDANFKVEITNNTNSSAVFKLSVLDFGSLNESGGVAFLSDAQDSMNKYTLASWVSLEKDALVIDAGEKQAVKVTIQNKESLSPGGHYAAVLAKLENENSQTDGKASEIDFNQSFASLIFVRKIGGEVYGLNLKESEIDKGLFNLPQKIDLRFQNTGNVHLTPRGMVKLTDPLGREVARGIINEESALVLPETFRVFPTQLKKMALAFVPGRYNLSIEYRYDGKDDFTMEQQRIFIIPMNDIWAGIIIILALYGWFEIKRRKK